MVGTTTYETVVVLPQALSQDLDETGPDWPTMVLGRERSALAEPRNASSFSAG
jgi:hypothetical protein